MLPHSTDSVTDSEGKTQSLLRSCRYDPMFCADISSITFHAEPTCIQLCKECQCLPISAWACNSKSILTSLQRWVSHHYLRRSQVNSALFVYLCERQKIKPNHQQQQQHGRVICASARCRCCCFPALIYLFAVSPVCRRQLECSLITSCDIIQLP